MDERELMILAGMLSKIAYELHDTVGISYEASELLLNLWRRFDTYNQLVEEES